MHAKRQMVVQLSPEEAHRRLTGQDPKQTAVLLTPSSVFYSTQDVNPRRQVAGRLVWVDRCGRDLRLTPPPATKEGHISVEDQVWLLANAARILRHLELDADLLCHLELQLSDAARASYVINNVHGELVDPSKPVTLEQLRGLGASPCRVEPATGQSVGGMPSGFVPHIVSDTEALRIVVGEEPGLKLALSTRGQYGAVEQKSAATPFSPHMHLAFVRFAAGLSHDHVTLLIEMRVTDEADTLAWRLRSVADRLIALGLSASTGSMISVHKDELLLDPASRVRDQQGRHFDPTRTYRLSQVRRFRDVEDLPSFKRTAEERIFDSEPISNAEYTLQQVLEEAARCVECGLCKDICPSHVGLVSYIDKLKQGDLQGAAARLRELNPGVDMTCQVCPAPCQELCILAHEALPRRPVNIRAIEQALSRQPVPTEVASPEPTGFKVALIGLGPANMVAAARLARKGHQVQVYEKRQDFGGAVALIPSFRKQPADAHQWVTELLCKTGVKIQTGRALGENLDFDAVRAEHDAVVLGMGAGRPLALGIIGEDLTGVIDALEVLRAFNKEAAGTPVGNPPPKMRNTIVIGGGDVAADVVRWYVRVAAQGARQIEEGGRADASREPEVANVVWAYRRGRAQMPVSQEILRDAEDELDALKDYQARVGIQRAEGELPSGVHFHLRPMKVIGKKGKVSGLQFVRTRPGKTRDRSGRPVVEDDPGSEFTIPADSVVVLAVGQTPDPAALKGIPGVSVDRHGLVVVDDSLRAAKGIYAVGDLIGGEILADAISHGRRVAESIHHEYLARKATIL